MAVNLANEIGKMGHDAYMFSQDSKLIWKHFKWLSIEEFYFKLATLTYMLEQPIDDYRIISESISLNKVPNEILIKNIRKWDMDGLFRVGAQYEKARRFTFKYLNKIATINRHLEEWYRKIGYKGEIIILENWIRKDLFNVHGKTLSSKIPKSVGFQRDGRYKETSLRDIAALIRRKINSLKNRHTEEYTLRRFFDKVTLCHGLTHRVVAEKMKKTDFFLYFHKPKNLIVPIGEGFGLPLFEAMACGCVVVAVQQEQIKFLRNTIPLAETFENAVIQIKELIKNKPRAEKIRARSLELIEKEYRFDRNRRQAIGKLLE